MKLQPLAEAHWPAARAIYEAGMATGNATFETQAPDWAAWDAAHLPHSRLAALSPAGGLLGWAALSAVSGRCAYGGVAEVSVYVAEAARGQGVGRQLLRELIVESEAHGIWTLQAGIFADNPVSIQLHTAVGFRSVGYRERIGQLHGVWRDTVLLERRSAVVGADHPAAPARLA